MPRHASNLLFTAALLTIAGCANDSTNPPPSPSVTTDVLDLNNEPVNLWKTNADQPIVVIFSRTDCPISNRFAPEIRRLHELFHPQGVEFFLVYVDPSQQPETIRRHLREYNYPCPALRDPKHALVAHCEATTTPEAVVFDKNRAIKYQGRINDLYAELGQPRAAATTHDLADAIEATIANRPVATPKTVPIGCPIADLR